MWMTRRRLGAIFSVCAMGAAIGTGSAVPWPAHAQQPPYPTKPVRLVIPFPAGGPSDIIGRLMAQRLEALWKQTVIVENRVGASGTIGAHHVALSPPDGYTLLLTAGSPNGSAEVLNPKTTPYRTLRDFAPVGFIGVTPTLFVVDSNLPIKDVKDFVALAKANPGKYNYAQASTGSAPHFAFEMLKQVTGIDVFEVPFNGAAPAMQAFAGGHVNSYMGSVFTVTPNLQTGRARPIGVASSKRIEGFPEVPTLIEQGFPVEWDTWYGVLTPAGVPAPLLEKLNADMRSVLDGEETRLQMAKMGLERRLGPREQMFDAVRTEIENATRVAKAAKMIKE